MNAKIYTGTLEGPDGITSGRFVKFEDAHNMQQQIDILRESLVMVAQADTRYEAVGIAVDAIAGHDRALNPHPGAH